MVEKEMIVMCHNVQYVMVGVVNKTSTGSLQTVYKLSKLDPELGGRDFHCVHYIEVLLQ